MKLWVRLLPLHFAAYRCLTGLRVRSYVHTLPSFRESNGLRAPRKSDGQHQNEDQG